MLDPTITLEVGEDLAKVYQTATPDQQKKAAVLVRYYLRTLKLPRNRSLPELMDAVSLEAQARGLTPEILDDILNDR